MPGTGTTVYFTCARCLSRYSNLWGRFDKNELQYRPFSTVLPLKDQQPKASEDEVQHVEGEKKTEDESVGALSRRLAEMTEESIESGGRTAQKIMDEAGFSEELKRKLEAKIQDSNFRNENPAAFAQMDMPVHSPNLDKLRRMTDRITVQRWQGHAADRGGSAMVRCRVRRRRRASHAHRFTQAHARAAKDP